MKDLVQLFKVISDETRLRIMMLLLVESLCVCEISGVLDLSQPKVSKHLTKLRDLNLVQDERNGKYIFYSLTKDVPLLTRILQDINQEIASYPILKKDLEHLEMKDQFLDRCQINF